MHAIVLSHVFSQLNKEAIQNGCDFLLGWPLNFIIGDVRINIGALLRSSYRFHANHIGARSNEYLKCYFCVVGFARVRINEPEERKIPIDQRCSYWHMPTCLGVHMADSNEYKEWQYLLWGLYIQCKDKHKQTNKQTEISCIVVRLWEWVPLECIIMHSVRHTVVIHLSLTMYCTLWELSL